MNNLEQNPQSFQTDVVCSALQDIWDYIENKEYNHLNVELLSSVSDIQFRIEQKINLRIKNTKPKNMKQQFIDKWKSWWMLQKQGAELTDAFERELNAIIEQEVASKNLALSDVIGGGAFIRYLITTKKRKSPFLTKWFEPDNHFNPDIEMMVYDLVECKFTRDGKTWHDIDIDHL